MTGRRVLHSTPSPDRANPNDADWDQLAACATVDPELFHVPGNPPGWETPAGIEQAEECRAICEPCPLRTACLQFALAMKDGEGFFGGMTPQERTRFARPQKRPSRSKETA